MRSRKVVGTSDKQSISRIGAARRVNIASLSLFIGDDGRQKRDLENQRLGGTSRVWKRYVELGYAGMVTGLRNIHMPAGTSPDKWDLQHFLVVNEEVSVQKEWFLLSIASGSIRFCLGITEPDAGSEVAGIKTTGIRQGDNYLVNGSKKRITNAIWADYVTAAVRTGGPGASRVSVLIIPLKASGVSIRKMLNSGVGASGNTFVTFDDVLVPVEDLVHKENRGFEVMMSNFNVERNSVATQAIRLSRVCAEDAWKHACTRETFRMKLIENLIIRAKFVKMGRIIEPGRKNGGDEVRIGGMTAMLKIISTRCLEKRVREAQQIMGGLRYARGRKGGR
ncbi:hypothetical protein JHW43_005745 [Diplocarpon mali]|nr:hypothetical protein JHW43_005745 [Diplocarpon mali]